MRKYRPETADMSTCYYRNECINPYQCQLLKKNYHKYKITNGVQWYLSIYNNCRRRDINKHNKSAPSPYNYDNRKPVWNMDKASWEQQWLCRRWV